MIPWVSHISSHLVSEALVLSAHCSWLSFQKYALCYIHIHLYTSKYIYIYCILYTSSNLPSIQAWNSASSEEMILLQPGKRGIKVSLWSKWQACLLPNIIKIVSLWTKKGKLIAYYKRFMYPKSNFLSCNATQVFAGLPHITMWELGLRSW